MLKVPYGKKPSLIKDQTKDHWLSGLVLWGSFIPAPGVIAPLLLALCSVLPLSCPHLYLAWPSAPSTNRWKPDMEILKVPYGEKLSPVRYWAQGHRLSFGAPSFQHPGLLLHCCWPYTQSSHFTALPSLYECITLCAGEGLRTPMSLSLPSLAFCPKHKPLEARHGNAESPLWRKTVSRQGSNPGPPALWVGAAGLLHSSTQGYCPIVVGLILSPPTLLSYLACMSVLHCVLGKG